MNPNGFDSENVSNSTTTNVTLSAGSLSTALSGLIDSINKVPFPTSIPTGFATLTTSIWSDVLSTLGTEATNVAPNIGLSGYHMQVTGTGTVDINTLVWTNRGAVPNSAANGSSAASVTLGAAVVDGLHLTGTIGYTVTYVLSGSAVFSSNNGQTTNVTGQIVPQLTLNLGFSVAAGATISGTAMGTGNSGAVSFSVPLSE